MGNTVADLADRALAERHQTFTAEIRALLDAALVVMQRADTIDPRVTDIVRESGLSNQAFYRHFDGKDALLLALLADGRGSRYSTTNSPAGTFGIAVKKLLNPSGNSSDA